MKFMQKTAWLRRAGYLFGALLAGCGGRIATSQPAIEKIERYGDIEVVSHSDAETADGDWSLRRHGQPLAIDSVGGMWLDQPMRTEAVHAIFVVGEGAVPDLLVLVGDPNNASVFHVLHQEAGNVQAPVLCKNFGGENVVRVLTGLGAGTAYHGPNYRSLTGARQLLLGNTCVYDTATRRASAIPRLPFDLFAPHAPRAIVFSPDGRSVARLAATDHDQQPLLAEAELGGQDWSRLPIDPARMRFAEFADIDADWILHHFEWRRGKDGRDRLVERSGFEPMPRRGRYLLNTAQFRMGNVTSDQTEAFTAFLARFPGAKRKPDFRFEYSQQVTRSFEIEGEDVVVLADGFYVSRAREYWHGQPGDPKLQDALVHRLGEAFEHEVAKGMHDAMFQPQTATHP
ncbi:MAG: hypothetical protein PHH11_12765 [Methylomonas sp.]|nr:hypothetical protein [Methylomonas sp.]